MGIMVKNVCVKFKYDRLRIDKDLGGNFRNLITTTITRTKTTFIALDDPFYVQSMSLLLFPFTVGDVAEIRCRCPI